MRKICLIALLSLTVQIAFAQTNAQPTLNPYTTDGCSQWPDGWPGARRTQWRHCCVTHDVAYWQGGTRAQRIAADRALRNCVAQSGVTDATRTMGILMRVGVHIGGSVYFPFTWRWGYGWNYERGYAPLTNEERALVQSLLPDDPQAVPITNPGIIRREF